MCRDRYKKIYWKAHQLLWSIMNQEQAVQLTAGSLLKNIYSALDDRSETEEILLKLLSQIFGLIEGCSEKDKKEIINQKTIWYIDKALKHDFEPFYWPVLRACELLWKMLIVESEKTSNICHEHGGTIRKSMFRLLRVSYI